MDNTTMISMKKQLNVTDLSGEKVMIDFETGKYFMVKGTGNDIWDLIQKKITIQEIVDKLTSEYDVSVEVCTEEVMKFLDELRKYDIIQEE